MRTYCSNCAIRVRIRASTLGSLLIDIIMVFGYSHFDIRFMGGIALDLTMQTSTRTRIVPRAFSLPDLRHCTDGKDIIFIGFISWASFVARNISLLSSMNSSMA